LSSARTNCPPTQKTGGGPGPVPQGYPGCCCGFKEGIVDPLEEAQKPLRDAVEPVREIDQAVRDTVKDVQDSFAGIGREKPEKQTVNAPTQIPKLTKMLGQSIKGLREGMTEENGKEEMDVEKKDQ